MPLSEPDMVNIVRHLRYPAMGLFRLSPSGGTVAAGSAGYRYFQAYGFLLWRMNNLLATEEATLLGAYYAAINFLGPDPTPGSTLTVTFSSPSLSSPVIITVTADSINITSRLAVANQLAFLVTQSATLQGIGMLAVSPYGVGTITENLIPVPVTSFRTYQPFNIVVSVTGVMPAAVVANGILLPPAMSVNTISASIQTLNGYLPILNYLEGAWPSTTQNLDTNTAAVWKHNKNEARDRARLYLSWQQHLSAYLGIPLNTPSVGWGIQNRPANDAIAVL